MTRLIKYIFILFFPIGQAAAQKHDTTKVFLIATDTSFHEVGNVHGKIYQFTNPTDTSYISLSYKIGTYDMGQASCYPNYTFTKKANGVFVIYVNARLFKTYKVKRGKIKETWN